MKIEGRKSRESGTFTVTDREIYGELTLAGAKSALNLHDRESFNARGIHNLNGILQDRTKVTLIDCISPGTGSGQKGKERYHFAELFPHFVVYRRHLAPDDDVVKAVQFFVDDAGTIFYDFAAFGSVSNPEKFIDEILLAENSEVVAGNNPQIFYFTGKHEVFSVKTILGQIVAAHTFRGMTSGLGIKNKVAVSITFDEPLEFEEAIDRVWMVTQFLGLVAGRPQNLLSLSLKVEENTSDPHILPVYWSLPPKRLKRVHAEKPHPGDMPLNAVRKQEEFLTVLRNWFDKQEAWRDARGRFFNCFDKQGTYDIDRLIAAANMFDILPSSAVAQDVQLTKQLKSARETSIDLFRSLPDSPERDSALSVLNRLGRANLKQKVRHRAKIVTDQVASRFPDLLRVTDEAVNCRNHYVHGSDSRVNYNQDVELVHLFIDTLEFVFAASDLIECGWDIKSWDSEPKPMHHPFSRFRVGYIQGLHRLQTVLSKRVAPNN